MPQSNGIIIRVAVEQRSIVFQDLEVQGDDVVAAEAIVAARRWCHREIIDKEDADSLEHLRDLRVSYYGATPIKPEDVSGPTVMVIDLNSNTLGLKRCQD